MRNKTVAVCLLFITNMLVFVSCSQEEAFEADEKNSEYKSIYETLKEEPTVSILSLLNNSRASGVEDGYPVFSSEDLNYLSSLSQEDFEKVRDAFIKRLKSAGIEDVESIQDSNYIKIFDLMDGHQGMDQLIAFAQEYITSPQGWNQIELLMPQNISLEQGEVYIYMATYIDKIGRPIYDVLTSKDMPVSRADSQICIRYLQQRLAIAGAAISTEEFIDVMTGGAATPLELIATGADLVSIWLDYEVCNHRWH